MRYKILKYCPTTTELYGVGAYNSTTAKHSKTCGCDWFKRSRFHSYESVKRGISKFQKIL